jgi:hypothetical protein
LLPFIASEIRKTFRSPRNRNNFGLGYLVLGLILGLIRHAREAGPLDGGLTIS